MISGHKNYGTGLYVVCSSFAIEIIPSVLLTYTNDFLKFQVTFSGGIKNDCDVQ
jgi:hypothetical protein